MKACVPLMLLVSVAAAAQDAPELVAQRIFTLCNQARQQAGLRPLSLDARLSQAALQHSQEMERLKYFAHSSPVADFATLARRFTAVGVYGLSGAENLFKEQATAFLWPPKTLSKPG